MTRLQRLASWTLGVTILLVAVGGFTRGSGSGFGCQDRWPLCENGLLGGILPRPEFHMVVEWTHRWVASIAVLLVVVTAAYAWWRHRRERGLRWAAAAAVVAILAQAVLGAIVVMSQLSADLVSVHLAVALLLVGLLTFVTVESFFAAGAVPVAAAVPDPRWRRATVVGAGAVYLVVLLGSSVHNLYVSGWPLVGGQLVPDLSSRTVGLHFAHRLAALATLVLLGWLAAQVLRRGRPRPEVRLVHAALGLFLLNIALGAAHVFTRVESTGLVVAHLLVATLTWATLVAAASLARRADQGREALVTHPVQEPVEARP